jgi:hypothetical protein
MEYIIFGFLDFLSKIRLKSTSKYLNVLKIYDLKNIEQKYLTLLNDNILSTYYFVEYLNASNNKNITNVNHMSKLIELDASGKCGINDYGIEKLNLVKLNANNNLKITNVNHMNKLIELYACGICGIDDYGIEKINLLFLNAYKNSQITNINHMNKLIECIRIKLWII